MKISRREGFTIVEIMIVVGILGLLYAVAKPMYDNVRRDTREKLCIANQKVIYEAAVEYVLFEGTSLKNAGNRRAQLTELIDEGYLKSSASYECPSSPVKDYDDYNFIYDDDDNIVDIQCSLKPSDHEWP